MNMFEILYLSSMLAPAIFMAGVALLAKSTNLVWLSTPRLWRVLQIICLGTIFSTGLSLAMGVNHALWPGMIKATTFGLILGLLVQLLGTVIVSFSARYLEGESNQRNYISALAAILASVHLLLLADHWLLLIAAWAVVGIALQRLLCFYPDRPFALLAAHKKHIADRLADVMLLIAAVLAWWEVGSGSLSDLFTYITQQGLSTSLQASAILLVVAVILRTALLPVHGWLIQVMEAPTPVSALLHAGVVNLGGFVLIRFAPMLEQASAARILLLVLALASTVLAGMVTLTRISIKVRLAWSTVAQMGFMLLECALGLYTLAALHLVGHSLYKAHAFLSASEIVRQTRLQVLYQASLPSRISIILAPVLSIASVFLMLKLTNVAAWPWWWSFILGLAWAPLLWISSSPTNQSFLNVQLGFGLLSVIGLSTTAIVLHTLPIGLQETPDPRLGFIALIGMASLYACQALLQIRPALLSHWRRWSYAGFYLDEAYTRLALIIWPTQWTAKAETPIEHQARGTLAAHASDISH